MFRNQRADRIKILGWDRNGFWLLLKRLEADRFAWPREAAVATPLGSFALKTPAVALAAVADRQSLMPLRDAAPQPLQVSRLAAAV